MKAVRIPSPAGMGAWRRALGWMLIGSSVALGLDGCVDETRIVAEISPTGQLELDLVGGGDQGRLYRLRDAVIVVQGPDSTLFLDSEKNVDSSVILALVPVGSYTSFLQEGWRLERVDGSAIGGETVLLSPNPDSFEVRDGERTPLVLRFRVGPEEVANDRGSGALEVGVAVDEPTSSALCASDVECGAGQVCCVAGRYGSCLALEVGEACPLPDLTVSAEAAAESMRINEEVFPADSCAIEEGCVAEAGTRRLLRFSTLTPNVGAADLVLGDPTGTPGFEFAPCHGHFHFEGYARYELIDATGAVAATGHKQAFCLLDSVAVDVPGAPTTPRFHCGFQGIQRGWADAYDAALDCQWVDITNVPSGEYVLRISINTERILAESNYDNNVVEVPVTVTDPAPPAAP